MRSRTLKPILKVSNILVFLSVKPSHTHCILDLFSRSANWWWGRKYTQLCMSVFRLRVEKKKRAWNHSLSLMTSTQRQWGAALISVTCPCASHQLHYGSISHASPANWIACEVVTMTRARATSVPAAAAAAEMRVKASQPDSAVVLKT